MSYDPPAVEFTYRTYGLTLFDNIWAIVAFYGSSVPYSSLSTVCTARVDLGFLIDATSSGRRYLQRVVQFVRETVRRFTISSSATRIGVVTYASRARRIIGLSGAYSRRRIYNAVGRIRILRGGRRIGRALSYARLYLFRGKPQCGRRRVLIVLAAGRALDRVRRPANALKGVGVEIFAIGLGSVSRRSLLKVTTDTKHVFAVGSTRLLSIVRTLKDRICYSPGKLTGKWLVELSFQNEIECPFLDNHTTSFEKE